MQTLSCSKEECALESLTDHDITHLVCCLFYVITSDLGGEGGLESVIDDGERVTGVLLMLRYRCPCDLGSVWILSGT